MDFSNCLISNEGALVLDTSVVINLNATGRAREIIRTFPNVTVVTKNAFDELIDGDGFGHDDGSKAVSLIEEGYLKLVELGHIEAHAYNSLTDGSLHRTLHNGEAATIAYAVEFGGIAVIDEHKARRICVQRFPELDVISTVDLLMHEDIKYELGEPGQITAIVDALRKARMNVPSHLVDTIISLIGPDTAATCSSLPRSKRARL